MDDFEIRVDNELFRVSERRQPGGALSCDVTWLTAAVAGLRGFTLSAVPSSREQLEREIRGFLEGFGAD